LKHEGVHSVKISGVSFFLKWDAFYYITEIISLFVSTYYKISLFILSCVYTVLLVIFIIILGKQNIQYLYIMLKIKLVSNLCIKINITIL